MLTKLAFYYLGQPLLTLVNATLPIYPNWITSKFLQKTQWWSEERLRRLQFEGLKQITKWARSKVPYYHNFPLIDCLDDLKEYPILTKKLIHYNFHALIARDVRLLSRKQSTGGTTFQVTIMRDFNFRGARQAGLQRFRSWCNVGLNKTCYLWGCVDIGRQPRKDAQSLYLPIERLTNRMQAIRYLRAIKDFRPDHVQGYTLPLVTLAYYELEEQINPHIGVIACNCETLLPRHRRLIEKAFRCDVFNFYGSQDLGAMAQDCSKHEGLHINSERYIVETTEDGRFLFTDLLSYAMPIIRYENRDIGKLSTRKCSCGRGLPLMKEVIGRVLSFLLTKKGGWLTASALRDQMYTVKGFSELIERHQIRQTQVGKITLLLKPWKKGKLPDLKALKKIWPSHEMDIEVKVTDSIPLSRSGKHLAVVTTFTPPWVNK